MENTCRLCLMESPEIAEELYEGCDILDKLSVSLSHYIPLTPNLPNKICLNCKFKIEDIYKFHQAINQNEIILQQKLNYAHNLLDNGIKTENAYYDENETDFTEPLDKPKVVDAKTKILQENNIEIEKKVKKSTLNESNCMNPENISEIDSKSPIKDNFLKEKIINNESKQYTCLTCFKEFSSQLKLLKHYQTIELEKFNDKNKIDRNREDNFMQYKVDKSEDGTLIYKCEQCFKKYTQKTYIERHVLTHIETRPFLCKLCGKTYQTASTIVAHGKMHTGLIYTCSYNCGYKSVHKHVVKDHEKRHAKEYKYKCEICGKGFQVKTWYEQHYNIHNGVKPFTCDICGKAFHLQKYLKTHKSNVHPQSSDRKPWICKLCSLPCDSKNTLNLHMKEKHNIIIKKSILCDICGIVVRDAQQLKEHRWSLHSNVKPYVCGICNKSFPKKFTLKVHEQTHTGKQYLCNTCDKMFSRKSTLQRHILRFHLDFKQKCAKCQKKFLSKEKFVCHQKNCLENEKQSNKTIGSLEIINK